MKRLILLILLCVASVAQASTLPDAGTYVWVKTPRWFGAKGDSATNDRAAFVSAIARLDTVVGGAMELPPGRYAIGTDSIRHKFRKPDIAGARPCFTLEGHGPSSQIWVRNANGGIELYADTAGNGHGNALIKDIDFYADTSTGLHPDYAIYVHNIGQVRFENCHFYGFKAAIKFKGAQECNINGGEALGNDTAVVIDSSNAPSVYANQINFRDFRVTGRNKASSIGYWIRGAQDGIIDGEQVTNCLYGKKQTDGQKYQCRGVHFEQNRWGVADFGGGDYFYIGCSFYANNVDYYNIAATAPFLFGCLFNDTLITGASSQRTGIWLCRGASGTKYMDSVVFASNENNWGWNVNSGSGNLPTGIRGVFPGTAADTTDFAIFAPGTIDMKYGVIAGGTTGSIWTRMQPQGADTAHGWNNGKAGWFILDGTNDTVAALYATTNTSNGWTLETYAGAANGDSTVARLSILGGQARTTIKIGPEHTISMWFWDRITGTDSLMIGVDTVRKVLLACDGNGDCIPLIRDSIGGGADSVMQYMAALRGALLRPYWGWYHSTIGRDSVWAFPITREMLIGSDSNIAISSTRRTTIGNPAWGHGFTKFMGHLIYNYFSTIGDSLIAYRAHDTISGPLPDGYVWTIDSVGHRMYWAPPTGGTTANDSSLYVIDAHTMMYIAQWISPGFFNFKNDSAGVQGLTIGSNTDNVTFTGKHITAIADTTLKAGVTRFNGHLVFAMIDTTGTDSVFWLELADSTNNLPTDGWALKFRASDTSMYFGAVSGGSGETDTLHNATNADYRLSTDSLGSSKAIKVLKQGTNMALDSGTAGTITIAAGSGLATDAEVAAGYLGISAKAADASGADSADIAVTGRKFSDGSRTPLTAGSDAMILQLATTPTPDSANWVAVSGDGSIALGGALTVNDDSHAHTSSTISGLDAANDISTGTLPVARGGTGAVTHTSGNVLIGAGTSAITSEAAAGAGSLLRQTTRFPLLRYVYSSTTSGDPGAGNVRFSSTTWSSATMNVLFDTISLMSQEVGDSIFAHIGLGDVLFASDGVDPTNSIMWWVTGSATNSTGYWTVPLAIEDSATIGGFTAGDTLLFSIIPCSPITSAQFLARISGESGTGAVATTIDPSFGAVLDIDSVGIDTLDVKARLAIPVSSNPTIAREGGIALDTNNNMLVARDTTGTHNYSLGEELRYFSACISDPDQLVDDTLQLLGVETEWAPFGITIVDCGIKTRTSSNYTVLFEEQTEPTNAGTESLIESVSTSSSTEAADDGTLSDASVAVGSIVCAYVTDADDITQVTVWFTYYINTGN